MRRLSPAPARLAFPLLAALLLTLFGCDSGPGEPPEPDPVCEDDAAINTGGPLPCEYPAENEAGMPPIN